MTSTNQPRINALKAEHDTTLEVSDEELAEAKHLSYTANLEDLKDCNVYIVTVPTPINEHKQPDLTPLIKASETIGKVLQKGDIAIYESTVYPGATEDDCVPILERVSGLTFNQDFYAGYSPERINPGDKEHRVTTIKKATSGSTPEVADYLDGLYNSIITAGTHKASSIKVAEASKVIEYTQRDINIAIMNEFAQILNALDIDTLDVLEAAGSKWNFLPFRPGLVGGHCIGVAPYYLSNKSQQAGYVPDMLIAGRRINDRMGEFIASKVVKLMIDKSLLIKNSNILVLGFAFKENCPDIRNTRVIDVIKECQDYGAKVDVYDPWVSAADAKHEYGIELATELKQGHYDAVILAVAHNEFKQMGAQQIRALGVENAVVYDIKYMLGKEESDARL